MVSIAQNNSIKILTCTDLKSPYQDAILRGFCLGSQNSSIKTLNLYTTKLNVKALSTFLRTTTSVAELDLIAPHFEEPLNPIEAARNLSASIAQNSGIEVLSCADLELVYQAAILSGLAKNTRIRKESRRGGDAMLLQALKCNSSLWSVFSDARFSDAERAEMKHYTERNKQLHAILQAPRNKLKEILQKFCLDFFKICGDVKWKRPLFFWCCRLLASPWVL